MILPRISTDVDESMRADTEGYNELTVEHRYDGDFQIIVDNGDENNGVVLKPDSFLRLSVAMQHMWFETVGKTK